ncbi:MAG: ribulose bisphosphate carboxylase small subunit [Rhizonema sp. PD38]|nr:ribulose bisphosphate carboxylase small subunit [Rhizonema sp. PD38]
MSYYISPRFLDKLAVHITKNFIELPGVRVPLILGVHGRKGEGKSFQCELVFEKMGIEVTHISGGELESPDAGDPSRLIRLRYRETAELIRVRGKMCVLMINDLDAGAGRFDEGTQYTVNTQLVNATLMNIADNPTNVQLPGSYDSTPLHRVPIIVTGNDFSTLYAPLVRDGRMEKFYWEPDRDDKMGIVEGIFAEDKLPRPQVEQLVDTFINQSIDFFSALRSRIYDEQIRNFIHKVGFDRISLRVVNSTEKPPEFNKPDFNLSRMIEMGKLMVAEQKRVENSHLVDDYNRLNRKNYQPVTPQEVTPAPETLSNGLTKVDYPSTFNYNQDYTKQKPTPQPNSLTKVDYPSTFNYNQDYTKQKPTPLPNSLTKEDNSSTFNYYQDHSEQIPSTPISQETLGQMRQIFAQGYHIGIEYVDERRFRTGSWQNFADHQIDNMAEAIAILESCLSDHSGEYVRIVAIDTKVKKRMLETIVQRPNGRISDS